MPKKMTQKKLTAKITKMEKGKSEAKIGDVAQILKAVKILLKKEALDFKSGKRKSMPLAKMLFSEASKALK